jgi:hypothetical protein
MRQEGLEIFTANCVAGASACEYEEARENETVVEDEERDIIETAAAWIVTQRV